MGRGLAVGLAVLCISFGLLGPAPAQGEPDSLGFTLSPSSGPPGTRVHFEGNVPPDSPDFSSYQHSGAYGLSALEVPTNPAGCDLIVGVEDVVKDVTADGHVAGSFVVGDHGGCFMADTDRGEQPARAGLYAVLLGCHGCTPAGTFTITEPKLARTGVWLLPLTLVGLGLAGLGTVLSLVSRRGVAVRA